ncbi:MAG: Histidine triad (HIT) protein [Candidatus Woesebacteria bacterium GW2011_GWB1_39_12]|uniref:Histidine triad (HIT) protein n=2 Tax=Candidatus Woeseibacteriota TaxID=1752722 RepID=A0A0G0QAA3_9BACT|nr:MAG: Histidine triad (HIT) protein [Candidatus Woesebacteria bacterium GW2011_GWA1_39_12]KKR00791.1 MAG: Histidine triad (HIT) protein [Candidatus Woesebacteria bacterium GW2011_GWB1_39_12]
MVDRDDPFRTKNQLNARLEGKYHNIAENVGKCVFCDLRDKYVVTKQDQWILTVNIFPYIDGQVLVLPERHIENYHDLTNEDVLAGHELVKTGIGLLQRELEIENYWIILRQGPIAGKTVSHLHWNIMPYIEGLNTWHFQEISITPLDLAERLRGALEK